MNGATFIFGWLVICLLLLVFPYLLTWALPVEGTNKKNEEWAPWFTQHKILKVTSPLFVLGLTFYVATVLMVGDPLCSFEINETVMNSSAPNVTTTTYTYGEFCAPAKTTPGQNFWFVYNIIWRFHIYYLFLFGLVMVILRLSRSAREWMGLQK